MHFPPPDNDTKNISIHTQAALISYRQTPIQEIFDPVFGAAGVRVLVKREDLNHPYISGNKWWKLKYNLLRAKELGHAALLTFGGAYSNHLYAVAAAAHELGMKSIGIVRGEPSLPLNKTLSFVEERGMHLHFISRSRYREKSNPLFEKELQDRFGRFYMIPEGGTNAEAIKGCEEFAERLAKEVSFDFLFLPVGTGGTMAGMAKRLKAHQRAVGVSVLKNGAFLEGEVRKWLPGEAPASWRIETQFDMGGYGRITPSLRAFIAMMHDHHNLPLDGLYTGKAMFGLYSLVEHGEIPRGSVVLLLHTGGLQGG
jgi:1-aminocyclopropane-1-carboxylate deaminase